jgi:FkbM family methyltransferase
MPLISTRTLRERLDFVRGTGLSGCLSKLAHVMGSRPRPGWYRHPAYPVPVEIRIGTTDFKVCRQWTEVTDVRSSGEGCRLVVDAGANIGASSLRLAARFPGSRVVAIELEAENFDLLHRNTRTVPSIDARHAGIWPRATRLSVGNTHGGTAWAHFAVEGDGAADGEGVQGLTVEEILEEAGRDGVDRIDVLKVDIEGGELELFTECGGWIDRVDAIMIELHEDDRPGATAAFENAVRNFPRRWIEGELICVARADARIREPGSSRSG